jgi:hypothetical protein
MVKHHQAVVEADVAVGQFQVVDGAAREFRLGEIFQIVAPVTEAAAERKRQVNFVQQFKPRHQRVQNATGCRIGSGVQGSGSGVWRFHSANRRNGKMRNGFAVTNE